MSGRRLWSLLLFVTLYLFFQLLYLFKAGHVLYFYSNFEDPEAKARHSYFLKNFKFVIIGTWKGGTTSLKNYLDLHPGICPAPRSEPSFLSGGGKQPDEVLFRLQHYSHCTFNEGEHYFLKNAGFLKHSSPARRLRRTFPNVTIVALLRNPVERLYSHWYMEFCKGRASSNFESFIPSQLQTGIYLPAIRAWLQHFPRENFLIFKSEDMFNNPRSVVSKILRHTGLPQYALSNEQLRTYGSSPKCEARIGPRPPLANHTRHRLRRFYASHNQELADFLAWENTWT